MWNSKKIVVSLTSYPKRISNVSYSIFLLLTKQTVLPDEIHVWLSTAEFIDGVKSLPSELQKVILHPKVYLHWIKDNTYCFKRHEIFDYYKNNDFYCFLTDDDVQYPSNMIQSTLEMSDKFPNAVINYTDYGKIRYNKHHQIHEFPSYHTPTPDNRWCGQSMIPSWIFPMDYFDDRLLSLRDKYCPICDETWLTQFFIKHHIGVISNDLPWGSELNPNNCNKIGIIQQVKQLDEHGLNFRDRCLMDILEHAFPENYTYYQSHFSY